MFRALDKRTGKVLHEMKLPANVTGIPMTYMLDGVQYLVMAIGAPGVPAELIAHDGAVKPLAKGNAGMDCPETIHAGVCERFESPSCPLPRLWN